MGGVDGEEGGEASPLTEPHHLLNALSSASSAVAASAALKGDPDEECGEQDLGDAQLPSAAAACTARTAGSCPAAAPLRSRRGPRSSDRLCDCLSN